MQRVSVGILQIRVEMMRMREIRVGIQRIRVEMMGMQGIRVGMSGIEVGMWEIRVAYAVSTINLHSLLPVK